MTDLKTEIPSIQLEALPVTKSTDPHCVQIQNSDPIHTDRIYENFDNQKFHPNSSKQVGPIDTTSISNSYSPFISVQQQKYSITDSVLSESETSSSSSSLVFTRCADLMDEDNTFKDSKLLVDSTKSPCLDKIHSKDLSHNSMNLPKLVFPHSSPFVRQDHLRSSFSPSPNLVCMPETSPWNLSPDIQGTSNFMVGNSHRPIRSFTPHRPCSPIFYQSIVIPKGKSGYGFTIRAIRVFMGRSDIYTLYHLVMGVDANGPAAWAGLKEGDLILNVNDIPTVGMYHTEVVKIILQVN